LKSDDLGALFGIDLDVDAQSATLPPVPDSSNTPKPAPKARGRREAPSKAVAAAPVKVPFKRERPTGAAIRKLRKLANLAPTAFARALGISVVTLYRWEESKGTLTLRSASMEAILAFQKILLLKGQQ
jgi:DNA-binding transcriptional regulator YiaG